MKFWLKNIPYFFRPNHMVFDDFIDQNYVHDLDKHEVRFKHYRGHGWNDINNDKFNYRNYLNYDEYLTHQFQKFDEMIKSKGGFSNRQILSYRLKFYRRFRYLKRFLSKKSKIICAGARQGTEVQVLRDLGYFNSIGIDLNPGPNNKLVNIGDFMKIGEPDSSIDMIYCNSIDHAFDLKCFLSEHSRVIKPEGFVLYDITIKSGGAFEAVDWQSSESLIGLILKYFKKIVQMDTEGDWQWVLLKGKK